jgi:hypothetical protein
MANEGWCNPTACSAPTNWQIASVLPLTVHITSIWPLTKMSPDRALAYGPVGYQS